jgi:hypothetical protein
MLSVPAHAQQPGGSEDPSALVGSPFVVTSSLDIGAAALIFCDEPTQSVCEAICECILPGPDGAYCIAMPAFTCSHTHCRNVDCGYWPE